MSESVAPRGTEPKSLHHNHVSSAGISPYIPKKKHTNRDRHCQCSGMGHNIGRQLSLREALLGLMAAAHGVYLEVEQDDGTKSR